MKIEELYIELLLGLSNEQKKFNSKTILTNEDNNGYKKSLIERILEIDIYIPQYKKEEFCKTNKISLFNLDFSFDVSLTKELIEQIYQNDFKINVNNFIEDKLIDYFEKGFKDCNRILNNFSNEIYQVGKLKNKQKEEFDLLNKRIKFLNDCIDLFFLFKEYKPSNNFKNYIENIRIFKNKNIVMAHEAIRLKAITKKLNYLVFEILDKQEINCIENSLISEHNHFSSNFKNFIFFVFKEKKLIFDERKKETVFNKILTNSILKTKIPLNLKEQKMVIENIKYLSDDIKEDISSKFLSFSFDKNLQTLNKETISSLEEISYINVDRFYNLFLKDKEQYEKEIEELKKENCEKQLFYLLDKPNDFVKNFIDKIQGLLYKEDLNRGYKIQTLKENIDYKKLYKNPSLKINKLKIGL